MNPNTELQHPVTHLSRRQFLATSAKAATGATVIAALPRPGYTAEDNTIKLALIGCGGRGTGAAAQALSTKGPVKLWAMADYFENRLQHSLSVLKQQKADLVEVPPERQFVGLDGFKKAMATLDKGSLVLLTTPPAFRPIHVEAAIAHNLHVFMEKSFAVDGPGIRRILKCGEQARTKNLKVAGGLMSRHSYALQEAIQKIHEGIIGDVITAWAYRVHGTVKNTVKNPAWAELDYQIANYSSFTWLNGSFIVDWLIHNIDVCCWVKDAWPVSVQGMGGRQVREDPDQLFDHYAAEYSFPDGTRMVAQGRLIDNCWSLFGDKIHGTKGSAVLGEGVPIPRIFKGHNETSANLLWSFKGEKNDFYQTEHDILFDAIRNDKPHNEVERCAKTNLVAIMGRMACESGQEVTFEQALNSNIELAPGLEHLTREKAPVVPDANGQYPIAKPGRTIAV